MVPAADADHPPTCEIRGWAVFAPGYHKGTLYGPEDVARAAENFRRLKAILTPHLGLGHDKEQRVALSLGLPAVGDVTDARPGDAGTLVLDLGNVPTWLGGMVNAGRYDDGSVELNPSAPDPGDPARTIRGPILTGIALLGEEQPAVKLDRRKYPPPKAVFADGTEVPPNYNPLPVPHEALAAMSAGYRPNHPTLCFSETPMPTRDEMNQQLQACGLDPATYADLPDEKVKAILDGMNGQGFADAMKKKYADAPAEVGTPAGGTPAPESTPAAPDQNEALMAACKKMFADELKKFSDENEAIKQRLGSVEKAYSDKQEEERKDEEKQFSEKAMSFLSGPQGGKRIAPALRPALAAAAVQAVQTKKFGDKAHDTPDAAFEAWKASVLSQPESLMFSDAIGPVPQKTEIASNPILGATIRKGGVLDKLAPATAKRLRESAAAGN